MSNEITKLVKEYGWNMSDMQRAANRLSETICSMDRRIQKQVMERAKKRARETKMSLDEAIHYEGRQVVKEEMSIGKYERMGKAIGELVDRKNKAYGDSFKEAGNFLKILYPDGVEPEQYGDMLTVVRVFDKLMRVANQKEAFNESPWVDIAGYAILKAKEDESE